MCALILQELNPKPLKAIKYKTLEPTLVCPDAYLPGRLLTAERSRRRHRQAISLSLLGAGYCTRPATSWNTGRAATRCLQKNASQTYRRTTKLWWPSSIKLTCGTLQCHEAVGQSKGAGTAPRFSKSHPPSTLLAAKSAGNKPHAQNAGCMWRGLMIKGT